MGIAELALLGSAASSSLYVGVANHFRAQGLSGQHPPPYQLPPRTSVSLIVPAYQEEKYIARLLESAGNQTEPFSEVIVADCSDDDQTAQIAESFGAKVLRVPKGNLSLSKNLGADAAQGEVLAFADGDMALGNRYLEQSLDRLDGGAVMVHPHMTFYDSTAWHLGYFIPQNLRRVVKHCSSCQVMNRETFHQVEGFDENCNSIEKWCPEQVHIAQVIQETFGPGSVQMIGFHVTTSARRFKKHPFFLDSMATFDDPVRRGW